jgi:hypothetical protein
MKKLLLVAFVSLLTVGSYAQINTPAPSPFAKMEQVVGLTDVSLEYSRPAMRGRTIFGNLVPYGKIWRTGANQRTKITFSTDFTVGGKDLKAGTYAIFTKPEASSWTVYFYTEYQGGGAPSVLDDSKVAAMVKVPVQQMPMNVDSFTITIDELKSDGAHLGILWENTYVAVPFGVPTDATVSSQIEKVMSGPDAGDYYSAAVYLSDNGKDINKAKEYMDKAMSMIEKPRFWQLRQQSLILAKSGDKKGAIKAAKASLVDAKASKNDDYIKLNMDSLKEWGAK